MAATAANEALAPARLVESSAVTSKMEAWDLRMHTVQHVNTDQLAAGRTKGAAMKGHAMRFALTEPAAASVGQMGALRGCIAPG